MMNSFNKHYWEMRYQYNETQWDLGDIAPPIKFYFKTYEDQQKRILIPGAGNAHEASYLWRNGFKNVYILDIAKTPLENFQKSCPSFPKSQIIHEDFFNLKESFDMIIEHTFFCALNPLKRKDYVSKANELLSPKGILLGLLFNFELTEVGPPFGGSKAEYKALFQDKFNINHLEIAKDSVASRANKELFFIFEKL